MDRLQEIVVGPGNFGIEVNSEKIAFIDPEDSSELGSVYTEAYKSQGYRIADPEEYPKFRDMLLEKSKGERYPSMSWNFSWKDYVLVGGT